MRLERNPDYWGRPYYFSRLVYRHEQSEHDGPADVAESTRCCRDAEKDHYFQNLDNPNVVAGKVKSL